MQKFSAVSLKVATHFKISVDNENFFPKRSVGRFEVSLRVGMEVFENKAVWLVLKHASSVFSL